LKNVRIRAENTPLSRLSSPLLESRLSAWPRGRRLDNILSFNAGSRNPLRCRMGCNQKRWSHAAAVNGTQVVSRCRAPVALRHRTSSTPAHAPQHDSIMQSSSEHSSYAACERSGCEPALHGMEVAGGESPRRDKRATREILLCKLRLKGLYLSASEPSRHQ
jgi:hypothetical protein